VTPVRGPVPAAVRAGRATLAGRAPGLLWRPGPPRSERAGAPATFSLPDRHGVHPERPVTANGQQA
jgi:hypothetical protein